MPPVLARLPEIEPEDAPVEEESHFIDGKEGKKFRIDNAQPNPNQPAPETPDEKTPAAAETPVAEPATAMANGEIVAAAPYPADVPAAIDSLTSANQIVSAGTTSGPKLPPLPTTGFSDTAAKIMAQLEGEQVADANSISTTHNVAASAATTDPHESLVSEPADYVSSAHADRNIRIDPGIPKPVPHGIAANDAELAQKRKIARGQAPPELDVLDSPWHDWIVKLGGTFIAGLLLIAAFQTIQPKSPTKYAGADPQMDAELLTNPSRNEDRFASAPVAQEPGAFDAVLDVVAPPAEPTGDPIFVDPEELDGLATGTNGAAVDAQPGYEPVEIATSNPEPSTTSMPSLDELAGDLMPAPAVEVPEDTILPMPSDDGDLKPEVAAVIENNLVGSNGATSSTPAMVENSLAGSGPQKKGLFGPPNTESANAERVAMNPKVSDSITPIANPQSRYPATGYAPVTRVRTGAAPQQQQLPLAPPQQSVVPQQQPVQQQARPQFNLFPQTGQRRAPVQPGVAQGFAPIEPQSPLSVQLNGTIQRYSR